MVRSKPYPKDDSHFNDMKVVQKALGNNKELSQQEGPVSLRVPAWGSAIWPLGPWLHQQECLFSFTWKFP